MGVPTAIDRLYQKMPSLLIRAMIRIARIVAPGHRIMSPSMSPGAVTGGSPSRFEDGDYARRDIDGKTGVSP
jgi:hypothetical protein